MEILGLVNIPLWLLIVIALCLLLYIYGVRTHDVFTKMEMDGPKPWPLLGNMPEVMRKGFVESNEQWFKKYGRVFGIFEGTHPLIYAGDVEMLKDITVKEFNKFPNRRGFGVEKYLDAPSSEFLTLQKDDNWRHNRNTLTPTFSGGKLKRMMSCIVDAATTFTNNLKPVADNEEPIDIKLYTGAFTMDTIAASAFGIKLDTKTTPDDPFIREAKKFFELKILSPIFILMFFFPFLLPLIRVFNIPFAPPVAVKFFSDVTNQALIERRANPGKYFDFLQLMINAEKEAQGVSDGHSEKDKSSDAAEDTSNPYWRDKRKGQGLTDTEILAAAILFFTAGYETTATSLVHAFFHLSHNPEAQNKLIAEIDEHYPDGKPPDYETIGTLQYLEMVVMETLRMNPPLGRMDRICSEDTVVHGYKIPAGVGVALPIYMIHHDPGYWPDPETFDPERFTPENREKHHPLQWIPFGYGPRNCIGMRLALLEMKIALVKFFQKYRIATNSKTVPLKFGETALLSVQKGGVWLTVKHRQ